WAAAARARELELLEWSRDERRHGVADLRLLEVAPRVLHSGSPRRARACGNSGASRPRKTHHRRTTVTWRMLTAISPVRSVTAVSRTTNAMGPLRPVFS